MITVAFFTFPLFFTVKPIGFVHKFPAKQTVMEEAPGAAFPVEVC